MVEREEWGVIDSSKLQDYMSCARYFWWKHVLGWSFERPDVHLVFGTAWHLAMQRLYPSGTTPDYSDEAVVEACLLFEEEYRKSFSAEMDADRSPKTPANAFRGLTQYVQMYRGADKFTTHFTEVAGSVFINSSYNKLYFKMDTVVEDPAYGMMSLEHKTGSKLGRVWTDQWPQKIQIGTYSHVLYSLFPSEQIYGIIINGFFPTDAPKLKLNGEPYAGATDNKFVRVPIRRRVEQMEDWYFTVNYWYAEMLRDFDRLASCTENDSCMLAFPKNTENCTKYFGCPFSDFCQAWTNPLQRTHKPQPGFKVEFWDPRKEASTVSKIVEV